jgi:hypothetical protein
MFSRCRLRGSCSVCDLKEQEGLFRLIKRCWKNGGLIQTFSQEMLFLLVGSKVMRKTAMDHRAQANSERNQNEKVHPGGGNGRPDPGSGPDESQSPMHRLAGVATLQVLHLRKLRASRRAWLRARLWARGLRRRRLRRRGLLSSQRRLRLLLLRPWLWSLQSDRWLQHQRAGSLVPVLAL